MISFENSLKKSFKIINVITAMRLLHVLDFSSHTWKQIILMRSHITVKPVIKLFEKGSILKHTFVVFMKGWIEFTPKKITIFNPTSYKDKTEKPCTGKTVKNDRRNDCNWLILALKDTWHYEKDWKSTHKFVKMLFYFWGDWKWNNKNHKHTKFSKLSNFVILLCKFLCYMLWNLEGWVTYEAKKPINIGFCQNFNF